MNKIHWRLIAFVIIVIGLRAGNAQTANIAYLLVIGYALSGRMQAIQALSLSWLFIMINPGLAPSVGMAGLYRYGVLLAALISVVLRKKSQQENNQKLNMFIWYTIGLGLFFIIHSLVISPIPDVSILKALSWLIAMVTVLLGWSGLAKSERDQLATHLYRGLVLILILSLPLAFFPVGYLVNGTGFQGVLNQPQAFGPVMGVLGAWSAARLFAAPRPPWWLVGLVGVCLAMVLMSEARTAGFSFVLGVSFSLVFSPAFANVGISHMAPGIKSSRLWVVFFFVLVAGISMSAAISQKASHYVTKSGRADVGGVIEAYDRSRGGGMKLMWRHFLENPWSGSGFGISSFPEQMDIIRDPIFHLPISASVEKGVTYLAVLEELGFIGGILVLVWLFMLLKGSARGGLAPFAVCTTILLLNMGEATLFSPGGVGLLYLILLGWVYSSGLTRNINE